jgi:hypothetical protein
MWCRYVRAHILLARGDVARAIVDAEKAVEVAREWNVWGYQAPLLAGLARIVLATGRFEEANALVAETIGMGLSGTTAHASPDLAVALVDLGRRDELVPAIEALASSAWLTAVKAFVAGDFVCAAELYAEIGSLPDEADARLRSGHPAEVRKALAFYRSVAATRYIREGEAMLAASV